MRDCEQHVREALLTLGIANSASTPNRVDLFIEDFGIMTPNGDFTNGCASLDLFPSIVLKHGDDLIFSKEWRLMALKALVSKSMHYCYASKADQRASYHPVR